MGFSSSGAHPRKGAVGFKLVEVPAGRLSPHSSEVAAVLAGGGGGQPSAKSHVIRLNEVSMKFENVAIPTVCIHDLKESWGNYVRNSVWAQQRGARGLAGLRGDEPSRRLAARTASGRAAAHGHVKQPGPAGRRPPAHTAAGPHSRGLRRPEHPWSRKQPSGTGRRHDPRLGRQGPQS